MALRSVLWVLLSVGLASGSRAAEPVEIGAFAPGGLTYSVRVAGDVAYIAATNKFHVVDISDLTNPNEIAFLDTDFEVELEVVGNRVYTQGWGARHLKIIDVSTPGSPVVVGDWSLPMNTNGFGLEVVGDHVYLALAAEGLRILDVSNETSPSEIGFFDPLDSIQDVAVAGDVAYLAASEAGVLLVDVSNPAVPQQLGSLSIASALSVAVAGDRLYVLGSSFQIYDVSNPVAPALVGSAAIAGTRLRVNSDDALAYLGGGPLFGASLSVVDISDETMPVQDWTIPLFVTAGNSDGRGRIVFALDTAVGLRIFRLPLPPHLLPTRGGVLAALALLLAGALLLRASVRSGRRAVL